MAAEELYPPRVVKTLQALLTQPATSPPSLRQAVLSHATKLAEKVPSSDVVPDDLTAYLDQVVVDAERITDADVQGLKDRGHSEEQIFELTLCAAFGAALARLERGLAALQGAK